MSMYFYLFYFSKCEREVHFDKQPFTLPSVNQLSQISAAI